MFVDPTATKTPLAKITSLNACVPAERLVQVIPSADVTKAPLVPTATNNPLAKITRLSVLNPV